MHFKIIKFSSSKCHQQSICLKEFKSDIYQPTTGYIKLLGYWCCAGYRVPNGTASTIHQCDDCDDAVLSSWGFYVTMLPQRRINRTSTEH